jgi:UPF0271 protein
MKMNLTIDLNADLGERPVLGMLDGSEEQIIGMISSANIACGGHAGDENTMAQTLALCAKHAVAIGAHPGFPDRANFGRVEMPMTANELADCVFEQVRALGRIAQAQRVELQHVKPHGALYNLAAQNKRIAEAVALGVARWSRELILVGLAHSAMLEVWQAMSFRVVAEAFIDRVYEDNGTLRSRSHPGALIHSPEQACAQALRLIKEHSVIAHNGAILRVRADTLCIHSDTPNAAAVLAALRAKLKEEKITVVSFSKKEGGA